MATNFPLHRAIKKILDDPNSRPEIPGLEPPEPEPEPDSTFPLDKIGVFPGGWSESVPVSSSKSLKARGTDDDDLDSYGLSGSPAVAVFNDTLYCVYEGPNNNGFLYYTTFDGQNWSKSTLTAVRTSGSPALAVFKDKLYCVHEGYGEDGWLHYFYFDKQGRRSVDEPLPNHGTTTTNRRYPCASLAVLEGVFEDKLYCVHEGKGGGAGWLFYTTFDGETWSEDKPLSGEKGTNKHGTTGGGSLVAIGESLICLHEGKNTPGEMWYTVFTQPPGSGGIYGWTPDEQLTIPYEGTRVQITTTGSPGLIEVGGLLYWIHEGRGNDGHIWYYDREKGNERVLTSDGSDSRIGTTGTPAIVYYKNQFYILNQGKGNSGELQVSTTDVKTDLTGEILLIDANTRDATTPILYKRRQKVLHPYVRRSKYAGRSTSLAGDEVTRANVQARLKSPTVVYCTAAGHGLADSFYGQMDAEGVFEQVLGKRRYDPLEAKNKIFHFLACLCGYPGIGLGQDLVNNGAKAFLGYSDKFQLLIRARREFLDCDMEIDIALLEGDTVGEAYDRAIAKFNETIKRYRDIKGDHFDPIAASILEKDRDILVFYGDKDAKL